uniref:Uncharacterized protein n=1 Tax=Ficedula albicollis TaxID=59894 RepID=U3JRN6_FICAL
MTPEWDSAQKAAQSCILISFIKSKAEPELELEFPGSQLVSGSPNSVTQDDASISLDTWSHRYLTEFLEIGGVLIPLEILGLNHLNEEDKRECVKLLLLTGDTGKEYKELICESCGMVQALTKFLNASNSAEGKKNTQVLLDSLGQGNPKYQSQDSQGLEAMLLCSPPRPSTGLCRHSGSYVPCVLMEPMLGVLCSVHLEVQYKGRNWTDPGWCGADTGGLGREPLGS